MLQKQTFFPLNTNFNPIIEVNYLLQERSLEKIRFHESMYLVLWDITTNGTIEPTDAILRAANKANKIFQDISLSFLLNSEIKNGTKMASTVKEIEIDDKSEIFLPLFLLHKIQKYKIVSVSLQQPSRRQNPVRNVLLLKSRQFLRKLLPLVITHSNNTAIDLHQ